MLTTTLSPSRMKSHGRNSSRAAVKKSCYTDVVSRVEEITPEFAANILRTKNKRNRSMNRRSIARFAAAMKAGQWYVNNVSIAFGKDGILLDGQNRLKAVTVAKVPIYSNVTYNLDKEAGPTMDCGISRSARDVLHLHGYPNAHYLAPIIRLACIYDLNDKQMRLGNRTNAVNNDQILQHAEFLSPEINQSVNLALECKHHLKPSVAGFCHYVFKKINPEKADDFMRRLITGINLYNGNPVMTLRDLLIESKVRGVTRLKTRTQIALYFKAWNAFEKGGSLSTLYWDENAESFPAVM